MDQAGLLELHVPSPRARRSGAGRLGLLARTNPIGAIGAAGILLLVAISLVAPILAPFEPTAQIARRFTEPSWTHIMGTDDVGRDVFSRLIYGARVSLWVGVVAVGISTLLGVTCGLIAGFFGGLVDNVLMRFVDVLLAFPGLILAIIIASYLGPSLTNTMIAIGIVGAPHKARIARAPVLSILTEDYILAARVLGVSNSRILLRHVLPNAMAPLIVSTSLSLSGAILADAGLSFLGLGTQPPDPSWGAMLQEGRRYMEDAWWMALYPGLGIMFAVLSFNLLGDGLRDILDPRLRGTTSGPELVSSMKITELKVFPTILTDSYFINIVKIETDAGLFGIGEGSLGGRDHGVLGTYKHLRELIIGRDPFQIEDIWQDLYKSTFWRGGPILLSAISGIDTALWDLKGKALGVPVYELLGGKTRDRARVYTHVQGETDEAMCDSALSLVDEGYTALRVTPSLFNAQPWEPRKSVRATIRTFEKLRRAVGEDIDLMIDVHHRFTPMENVQLGQGLQPFDPFFIEDPIPPDNLQSYELLRAKIDVPLATGEAMVTKWQFKHLIEKELIDYLRMDPIHSGGITETRKIAVMGEVHNINLVLHNPGAPTLAAICLQINAATSNFGILESPHHVAPHMAEIFPVHPVVRDGYYDIPSLPGLGLEFDEQAVARYDASDRIPELPHLRRADGSVADW